MGGKWQKGSEKINVWVSGVVAVVRGSRTVKTTHLDDDNGGVVSM